MGADYAGNLHGCLPGCNTKTESTCRPRHRSPTSGHRGLGWTARHLHTFSRRRQHVPRQPVAWGGPAVGCIPILAWEVSGAMSRQDVWSMGHDCRESQTATCKPGAVLSEQPLCASKTWAENWRRLSWYGGSARAVPGAAGSSDSTWSTRARAATGKAVSAWYLRGAPPDAGRTRER